MNWLLITKGLSQGPSFFSKHSHMVKHHEGNPQNAPYNILVTLTIRILHLTNDALSALS